MRLYVLDKWKIIRCVCAILVIGFVFSLAGRITSNIVETATSATKKLPIYSVETNENDISLTFDCAWGADDMPKILDILKENDVKATFFVLGEWAEKFPEVIKRMSEEGHEVANHSDTHPHIASLTYEAIKDEIRSANSKIEELTGSKNNLFRAPYGEYNDNVISAADELGFYTIQWDVDSLDWKNLGRENILNRVFLKSKSGSIILMHNGTNDTADVIDELIKGLKERGFSFKKVSEIIYKDNYTINHEGRQIKN